MSYVPVALFVYNRLEHTRKTVDALRKNELAKNTELFIFSDASRNADQKVSVQEVRRYIGSIVGFASVNVIRREKNLGLAKSILAGVTEILSKYDSIIVLEDDIVTSKAFLRYMNDALRYYKNSKKIGSISGFSFSSKTMEIPRSYPEDIYLSVRPSSWGWATWQDRWVHVDWEIRDYKKFKFNLIERLKFNRGGSDLSQMLDAQKKGKVDSWAVRWAYNFYKNNWYCIFPVISFVDNIGNDNSGVHSKSSNKDLYSNPVLNTKKDIKFPQEIVINKEILRNFRRVYSKNIKYYVRKFYYKLKDKLNENSSN